MYKIVGIGVDNTACHTNRYNGELQSAIGIAKHTLTYAGIEYVAVVEATARVRQDDPMVVITVNANVVWFGVKGDNSEPEDTELTPEEIAEDEDREREGELEIGGASG